MHSSSSKSLKNKNSKSRVYSKVNTSRKHSKTLRKQKNQKNTKIIQYGGYNEKIRYYFDSVVILNDSRLRMISTYDLIIMLIYTYIHNQDLTLQNETDIFLYISHLGSAEHFYEMFYSTNPNDKIFSIEIIENVSNFLNLRELMDLLNPKSFVLRSPDDVEEPIDFHEWLNIKTRSPKYKPISKTPSFLLSQTQIKKIINSTYKHGEIRFHYTSSKTGMPDRDFLSNNLKPKSGRFKTVNKPRALLPSGNNSNSNNPSNLKEPMTEETAF